MSKIRTSKNLDMSKIRTDVNPDVGHIITQLSHISLNLGKNVQNADAWNQANKDVSEIQPLGGFWTHTVNTLLLLKFKYFYFVLQENVLMLFYLSSAMSILSILIRQTVTFLHENLQFVYPFSI